MSSKRLYSVLVGLIVLLGIGVLAVAYAANGLLQQRSHELASLKAQKQIADGQSTQLKQDKKDIQKYDELNTIAQSIVPQDKNQAEAVREIVKLAQQSGIAQLDSISFAPSTLGTKTAIHTPNGLTQVTAVKGIPGVYNLQITIVQAPADQVPYHDLVSFLSKLEQNRRTAQVSSISIQPDPKGSGNVAFTLVINEFIKP